jgi:FKBP-type peptidyl-prolyl cis-trans isomerase (trigger factor)
VKRTAIAVALLTLLPSLFGAALVGGCGSGSDVPEGAVATIGDASITREQIQELIAQASVQLKGTGQSFPAEGTALYDEYMAKMVEYLVGNEIIIQSAPKYDVSVSDAEVSGQIKQLVASYGGQQQFESTLKASGMTRELLERTIKSQLLSQAMQSKVTESAGVTPAEIEAYWDAHKDELAKDAKTKTFAKAKATIRSLLLSAAQQQIWNKWMSAQMQKLGVTYAEGYDPAALKARASAAASPAP